MISCAHANTEKLLRASELDKYSNYGKIEGKFGQKVSIIHLFENVAVAIKSFSSK